MSVHGACSCGVPRVPTAMSHVASPESVSSKVTPTRNELKSDTDKAGVESSSNWLGSPCTEGAENWAWSLPGKPRTTKLTLGSAVSTMIPSEMDVVLSPAAFRAVMMPYTVVPVRTGEVRVIDRESTSPMSWKAAMSSTGRPSTEPKPTS